jgi:hypothetical protein
MHINWRGRRVDRRLFILDYRSSSAMSYCIVDSSLLPPTESWHLNRNIASLQRVSAPPLHGAARLQDRRVSYLGHRITALRRYHFISIDPSAEAHVTELEGISTSSALVQLIARPILYARCLVDWFLFLDVPKIGHGKTLGLASRLFASAAGP